VPSVNFKIDTQLLQSEIASNLDFLGTSRQKKRLMDVLLKGQKMQFPDARSTLYFDYLSSPIGFRVNGENKLSHVILEKTSLEGKGLEATAKGTGRLFDVECGLVIKSVGYMNEPLDDSLPFDDKSSKILNDRGRVLDTDGIYVSGWLKSGPVGVIASTMYDAFETAEMVLEDISKQAASNKPGFDGLVKNEKLDTSKLTSFNDWTRIQQHEESAGAAAGKPREKVTSVDEMLRIAGNLKVTE
jgi:adrenodoxin-NADP+ reductase